MNSAERAIWLEKRRQYIGGSDANILMSGNAERINRLWEIKTGRAEDDDLSDVLPVQIGLITEPLNLRWFEREAGFEISRAGEHVFLTDHPFMACTLDGWADGGVFEAKHLNAFTDMDKARATYWPQLHHNMAVTGAGHAFLSVFFGTLKYEWCRVDCDVAYLSEMLAREQEFWTHVKADTPPPGFAPVDVLLPNAVVEYDMAGNNEWGDAAHDWRENFAASKQFAKADKALKAMVPDDAARCFGSGLEIKRAKNRALRIKETSE